MVKACWKKPRCRVYSCLAPTGAVCLWLQTPIALYNSAASCYWKHWICWKGKKYCNNVVSSQMIIMDIRTTLLMAGCFLSVTASAQKKYTVTAPGKSLSVLVTVSDSIYYQLIQDGK